MPNTQLVSGLLQTERQKDGRRRLLRELVVDVDGIRIAVPENSLTDYSSIPWFGRFLVRWSKVDIAGVLHDRLYQTAQISRAEADRVWRLAAVAGDHHANAFQAWVGWLALRLFGWWAWWQLRRREAGVQL